MLVLGLICFMIIDGTSCIYTYSFMNKPFNELWVDTMPWVGLLWYKEHTNSKEAISGIILLTKNIAIGNTQEISKIDKTYIKNTTKAMFMSPEDHAWYCQVSDYTLHPEFGQDTLNTVALVKLENSEQNYQWDLLDWPNFPQDSFAKDLFAIGYTDHRGVLEQVVYRMKSIKLDDCIKFYKEEQLDIKWVRPTQYNCFTIMFNSEQCVFDAGMALVTNYTGNWTLLGMSTLGPGCSLPSRFLDLSSYIPWIEKTANITRGVKTRRAEVAYENDWAFDDYRDADQFFMEKFNDSSIILKPVTWNNTEAVYGTCGGVVIYRDDMDLKVNGDGEHGFGIYQFSHFDKHYANVTCITLTVECLQKSKLDVWTTQGFGKDDITPFIKRVPIVERGATIGPKINYIKDSWYNYELVNISNLFFKFEYLKEASLKITYYGTEIIMPTEMPTTTEMGSSTTRKRRSYKTHIRGRFKKAMRKY